MLCNSIAAPFHRFCYGFALWARNDCVHSNPLSLEVGTKTLMAGDSTLLHERQSIAVSRDSLVSARKRPSPESSLSSESYPVSEINSAAFINNSEMFLKFSQTIETAWSASKRTARLRRTSRCWKIGKSDLFAALWSVTNGDTQRLLVA